MTPDDYVITITDLSEAGFCLDGSIGYMPNVGVTLDDVESGRVTLGWLRTVNDAHCQRVARIIDQRRERELLAGPVNRIVRVSDFVRLGWNRENLRENCHLWGISWDDVRRGKVTIESLRALSNLEAHKLADSIEQE